MEKTNTAKKITMATVKSFIRKSGDNLYVNIKTEFSGMSDGCEQNHKGFYKAVKSTFHKQDLGVSGAWIVGSSRDYFQKYEDETFTGIKVSNCCGRFILAVKK